MKNALHTKFWQMTDQKTRLEFWDNDWTEIIEPRKKKLNLYTSFNPFELTENISDQDFFLLNIF